MLVIALIAFVYAVALPNFTFQSSSEVANQLGRFSSGIRSAYDLSVLSGKAHRLVIRLYTGEYWLEATDEKNFKLGSRLLAYDLTPEMEAERQQEFEDRFTEYVDLAGEVIIDDETDEEIPHVSPVLNAKDRLKGASWYKVDSLDWKSRSIGNQLMFTSVQTTHHETPVTVDEHGNKVIAMIYFFPQGKTEKSIIQIYYRLGSGYEPDQTREPYTLTIDPYLGVADITNGASDVNVQEQTNDG